jgi:Raf kinase inhibitor-like YbhB/YbcL family protein
MKIYSDDFKNGERLADTYAYAKNNASPSLKWEDVPRNAKELVIICEDPDAPVGTWVHWVLYGVPAEEDGIETAIPKWQTLDKLGHAKQGKNDFKKFGYDGPHPPPGAPHRYFFKLYALNEKLNLGAGQSAVQLRTAMEGKIIAEAEVYGTYSR